MNIFRFLADMSHLASILILLHKMKVSHSCSGISFKTQALYLIVYVTRYLDIIPTFSTSLWNFFFKIIFISSSGYIVYLMVNEYRTTQDPNLDTFKVEYLLAGALVLGILFPRKYTITEMLWAFSIWLESVAILPQLFMLQRTGEAETITANYIFALGAYREGYFDLIASFAGFLQTILYSDFFYIYYTRVWQGQRFAIPV